MFSLLESIWDMLYLIHILLSRPFLFLVWKDEYVLVVTATLGEALKAIDAVEAG